MLLSAEEWICASRGETRFIFSFVLLMSSSPSPVVNRSRSVTNASYTFPRLRAYKMCSISPSLFFEKNFAFSIWQNQSSLHCFLSKGDLSYKQLDTYVIGPVVAAQHVM